ncbi:MAG: AbrB/MazE/SpoVT family DNA-binding domain-containing protein [Bacilli bacterium]|nr:AbrB/MazE/SpoVT family DNA-binding domain-containing protein [Bacilli bacterium]
MKNTGVIRKIDELGRIVIPKELRKVLKLSSGDDLEIFVDGSSIVLQKYSAMDNAIEESNKLISSVEDLVDSCIYITDQEKIITKGDLENAELPYNLKELLTERKRYISESEEEMVFSYSIKRGYYLIEPIIQNSDANGLIIISKSSPVTKEDEFFVKVLKNIIENK